MDLAIRDEAMRGQLLMSPRTRNFPSSGHRLRPAAIGVRSRRTRPLVRLWQEKRIASSAVVEATQLQIAREGREIDYCTQHPENACRQ
jgi:hypothetical protein